MAASYISSATELAAFLKKKGSSWEQAQLPSPELLAKNFVVRIPYFYANLIDWHNPQDPLRLMVIPSALELQVKQYELADPIGDHTHEPVPGLIHRYPNRCLLILTTHCSVHCRFCFRRDVIGTPLPVDFRGIFKYLQEHQEIKEVILSGGDPATLPAVFLQRVVTELATLNHITTVRIHSRALAIDPVAVGEKWLLVIEKALQPNKVIVLHINHHREITPELESLVRRLHKSGILVLSQSVLLKGINTTVETLRELFSTLSAVGITPYYLHHLDKARGTDHFRVSIEEGKQLFTKLRGTISGHSVPDYVLDLPGGDGKVPVMWLHQISPGVYQVENFQGKTITYSDPLAF
jgi:lysine 2,3-aminomutase